MKRVVVLLSAVAICMAASLVSGQSAANSRTTGVGAKNPCPFDIAGLWRSDATTEINPPTFFLFSREGSVTLMGHSPDTLPQDFEMIDAVNYELVQRDAPKEIRFNTRRGNDAFQAGITLMDIIEYSEDSFTTRNVASGQKIRWVREQTERYFLVFAARSGTPDLGGPAIAVWSTLDGRETKVEALGLQLTAGPDGKSVPVFGQIPSELYDQLLRDGEPDNKRRNEEIASKEETVLIRFELTAREFEKTHKVFETWDKLVGDRKLPAGGPYLNAFDFIRKSAESIDPCGEKLKLQKLDGSTTDQIVAKHNPTQRSLEYIRLMRKKNNVLHKLFPWGWRPMLQLPGQ